MTTSIAQSITIAATPAEIMSVLHDVTALPSWSSVHRGVDVLQKNDEGLPLVVEMSVASAGITDVQTLVYTWDGTNGMSWTLRGSTTQRSQRGSYRLTPSNGTTQVAYRLDVDLKIPVPAFVVRQGLKGVVTAATKGLKKRVEEP